MTLISFDLVSDFDGSIKMTTNDVDFDSAVINAIHHLGYSLVTTNDESGLIECRLIDLESGDIENEFSSYSIDAANIEALTLLGHSVYESLTDAELNSINNTTDEEFEEMIEDMDDAENGKIVAFAYEL